MIRLFALILLILASSFVAAQETPNKTEPILVGPARLDLDTRSGDQSQRRTFTVPEAGDVITVDVATSEGGESRTGFDVQVSYDASHLAFQTAAAVNLFENAFLFSSLEEGRVGLVGLLLEEESSSETGSIAQITFRVLDDFPGESQVALDHLFLGTALRIDSLQIGTQTAIVTLGGEIPSANLDKPDFDGNGTVDFPDFLLFASGFGASAGDQSYNPILDLDSNGEVGFTDFLVFAQAFGT